ncbi:endonuclease NucS domain-containing protein [Deinococcus marmoris]|uniref:endonuclease NucS domain-containing protein n=1 Tax=Deinococcus marmoris TaxID=249408 RepID=UPI00096AC1C9|nr:endonuclease NucS domain-containing protein [Deinococcus marmoris]
MPSPFATGFRCRSSSAASTAEVGAYLVLIKRDGSLHIHAPTGIKPMNWQPRTDELTARVEHGRCVLHASRRSPEELVRVTFLLPHLALALDLYEEASFTLSGSEKQMQDALARHPDLIEPGLTVLDRELLIDSGGIDLYARDVDGRYVVVELKRGRATQDAVSQLGRYVATVQKLGVGAVRGILAAPSITAPALKELRARGLEFREMGAWPDAPAPAALPSLFD